MKRKKELSDYYQNKFNSKYILLSNDQTISTIEIEEKYQEDEKRTNWNNICLSLLKDFGYSINFLEQSENHSNEKETEKEAFQFIKSIQKTIRK